MLLNSRLVQNLLEAAEDVGLRPDDLLRPLGLDAAEVVRPGRTVEWTTFTAILAELSRLVDGDPKRLHTIGRRIVHAPSSAIFRRVAQNVVSGGGVYRLAERWASPANFPHLRFFHHSVGDNRLEVHAEIPDAYEASLPFLQVAEGVIAAFPELMGLPPSEIVQSRITPRTLDLVLDLPRTRSLLDRARRMTRVMLGGRSRRAILEEQLHELYVNAEALRRGRDELRVLLARLPDLVVVDVSGKIVWTNDAFVLVLRYERVEDVVGTALLDHVAEASKQVIRERMRQSPEAPGFPVLSEIAMTARTGDPVIVEVAATQLVVFDGVPARLVVGRDMTERVHMQQKLIVADRLASVGMLAAGVAHEVNNPLGYVLNNIEMARKELVRLGRDAESARQALAVALEGVARIRAIVHDLLMLARGEAGTVEGIDVRAVAASTLSLAACEIDRTARLVQDFRPAPLVIASDSRIAQVLLNLVGNALESMRDGPREENVLLVRISSAVDGRLLLEVSDTGSGIAKEDLPRVFEPFFTTKPAGQGTGLGLAIAQRLVVESGGEISVTSTLGRGTKLRVLLPAAATTTAAQLHRPPEVRENAR